MSVNKLNTLKKTGTINNFEIDKNYLTTVTIRREWGMYDGKKNITDDELVKILKGEDRCSSTHTEDHPEFTKLREKLGTDGYLCIQRNWWNGDRVTKKFMLNGKLFKKDDSFPCAGAMELCLRFKK